MDYNIGPNMSKNSTGCCNSYYNNFRTHKDCKNRNHYLNKIAFTIVPIHGYMALGGFKLHTGTLLYLSIIATAGLGGSFYKTKKINFDISRL